MEDGYRGCFESAPGYLTVASKNIEHGLQYMAGGVCRDVRAANVDVSISRKAVQSRAQHGMQYLAQESFIDQCTEEALV